MEFGETYGILRCFSGSSWDFMGFHGMKKVKYSVGFTEIFGWG